MTGHTNYVFLDEDGDQRRKVEREILNECGQGLPKIEFVLSIELKRNFKSNLILIELNFLFSFAPTMQIAAEISPGQKERSTSPDQQILPMREKTPLR